MKTPVMRAVAAALILVAPSAYGVARTGTQALAPPTNLRVPTLAYDDSTITLAWEKPDQHAGIVDYTIYSDGQLIGRASDNRTSPAKPFIDAFYADPSNNAQVRVVMTNYTVTGLQPKTAYRFTVRAVDSSGAESADSSTITQKTAAVSRVFNVADFGAVGDGTTVNTVAIQAAIDACTSGGKVLVPAGVFVTGAIWLKSDMTLEVAAGATLLGSPNADDYPYDYLLYDYSTDTRFYSLINAHTYDYGTLTNIRIVGQGIIDGNGWKQGGVNADGFVESLPSSSTTVTQNGILAKSQVARAAALGSPAPYATRSNLITMRGVKNAYYGGFTARNPSNHTLVNLQSTNVTVNGVRIETYDVNNADGIEFGNSEGLQVINSVFDTGDDCINFAAGLGAASEHGRTSRNAWIANNYFREGHGAVVAGSHTGAWIENILAEDNVMNHTDVGLRMKTDPANGGGARRVAFRDNAMKDVSNEGFIFTSNYSDTNAAIVVEPAAQKAVFHDILVDHVTVDGTGKEAIKVVGVANAYHYNLKFSDVRFLNARPTSIQYLRSSVFSNVTFDATPNPWVISKSTGLTFDGGTVATPVTIDASEAPAWPADSSATATTDDVSATLRWSAATDNVAVSSYQVYDGTTRVAAVPGTTTAARVTKLSPARAYQFTVVAEDATGNTTSGPTVAATTTGIADALPPVPPVGDTTVSVPSASLGTTWAKLAWVAASDNYGVARYDIVANGQTIGSVGGDTLAYTATGLVPGTAYAFTITAVDAAGNATAYPAVVTVTTKPPYDTAVPAWPAGASISAVAISATTVTLTWTAATDDRGVQGYRLYANGRPVPTGVVFTPISTVSTVATTTYTVSGLSPSTSTTFRVEAGDAAGRWSARGPSVTVRTEAV